MRRFIYLTSIVATLIFGTSTVQPQVQRGIVRGTVSDELGGVIPRAKVTLSSSTTRRLFSAITDNDGKFSISVDAGIYGIETEAKSFGFLITKRAPIKITNNAEYVLNLTLFAPRFLPVRYSTPLQDVPDDAAIAAVSFRFDELNITTDTRQPALIRYAKRIAARSTTTYVGIVPFDKDLGSGVYLSIGWFEISAAKIVVDRRSRTVRCSGSVVVTRKGEVQLKSEQIIFKIKHDGLEIANVFLSGS
jgi:hypothetical protein